MKKQISIASFSILFLQSIFFSIHASEFNELLDEPWYEVEVLVFDQSTDKRLNSEKWPQNQQLPDFTHAIDFITPSPSTIQLENICVNGQLATVKSLIEYKEVVEENINVLKSDSTFINEVDNLTNNPFSIPENRQSNSSIEKDNHEFQTVPSIEEPFVKLDPKLLQLNDVSQALSRRRGYRQLLHISWRQPILDAKHSSEIRLHAGINYSQQFKPNGKSRVELAKLETDLDQESMAVVDANSIDENSVNEQFTNTENTESNPYIQALSSSEQDSSNEVGSTQYQLSEESFDSIKSNQEVKAEQLNACEKVNQELALEHHPDVWQLDGTIKIYLERYLHLTTQLVFRLPGEETLELSALETSLAADHLLQSIGQQPESNALSTNFSFNRSDENSQNNRSINNWTLKSDFFSDSFLSDKNNQSMVTQEILNKYFMQQKRRLRSNELHYIDHPLFGMLIQIRPYDPTIAKEEANGV